MLHGLTFFEIPLLMRYYFSNVYNKVFQSLTESKYVLHLTIIVARWVDCHHGMACPQVVDRGDSLQIWRVAANILNKQPQTADSGWSSSFGVGQVANPPHKTQCLLQNTAHSLGLGQIIWHNI
jgi:hypothetical protein